MPDNHWGEHENVKPESSIDDVLPKEENKEAAAIVAKAKADSNNAGREWKLLEKLVQGLYSEQRSARRWGIFFKSLTFLYLFGLLAMFWLGGSLTDEAESSSSGKHTALIEINGPIAAGEEASADSIIWSLRRAFKDKNAAGIILRINSPGGSPVQSGYINDEIERLRLQFPDKKVYAVIVDIGASGAYYIAVGADEIYADKASLVGSIGVVASGFGFVDLMAKVGVERRLYTAGEHKAFLDPFSPADQQGSSLWQNVLNTTHKQFIAQVKEGRGDRLKGGDSLFSGLVWTGEQALALGLIDGLGSSSYVARDIIGASEVVDYSTQKKPWEDIIEQLGVSFSQGLAAQLGVQHASSPLQLR